MVRMIYPFSIFCPQDWGVAITKKGESPQNDSRSSASAANGRKLGKGGGTLRKI
ncbi:Hypothetical protein RAK1035_3661 [Roseovarius sp. AK1035]|nr:Hypothetical protein RAK1035_3661 [Roseovarius sp. AK1035]